MAVTPELIGRIQSLTNELMGEGYSPRDVSLACAQHGLGLLGQTQGDDVAYSWLVAAAQLIRKEMTGSEGTGDVN